jgi:DNA-binding NarL/FixJ family response regulator
MKTIELIPVSSEVAHEISSFLTLPRHREIAGKVYELMAKGVCLTDAIFTANQKIKRSKGNEYTIREWRNRRKLSQLGIKVIGLPIDFQARSTIDSGAILSALTGMIHDATELRLQGYTLAEIGKALNVSIGTVHNLLCEAKAKIQKDFENSRDF